jgi:hypothetical protein
MIPLGKLHQLIVVDEDAPPGTPYMELFLGNQPVQGSEADADHSSRLFAAML